MLRCAGRNRRDLFCDRRVERGQARVQRRGVRTIRCCTRGIGGDHPVAHRIDVMHREDRIEPQMRIRIEDRETGAAIHDRRMRCIAERRCQPGLEAGAVLDASAAPGAPGRYPREPAGRSSGEAPTGMSEVTVGPAPADIGREGRKQRRGGEDVQPAGIGGACGPRRRREGQGERKRGAGDGGEQRRNGRDPEHSAGFTIEINFSFSLSAANVGSPATARRSYRPSHSPPRRDAA